MISKPIKKGTSAVAEDGRRLVQMVLTKKGIDVRERVLGRTKTLLTSNPNRSRIVELRVKTKRGKGNWHSNTAYAKASNTSTDPEKETSYWIFVNLENYSGSPRFWVVPDSWMRNDIHTSHEAYLAKRGGRRAENDNSTHHSIAENRLSKWADSWNLLNLND